jgi:hypothetical protein
MELGPKAVIRGTSSSWGKTDQGSAAIVHGNEVGCRFRPLREYRLADDVVETLLVYGRPLAFGATSGGRGYRVLVSRVLPSARIALSERLERCVETLETRPGYSVLASVLTVLLAPVAIVLLAITIVGALLVPFLGAGLIGAKLFGKAVMLAWIGRRFTKFFGDGPLGHPVFAVLIGGLIVLLLYTVPVVGFVSFKLLSWLGLGVVVYTIALAMKREKPPAPVTSSPLPPGGTVEPEPAYPDYAAAPAARRTPTGVPPLPRVDSFLPGDECRVFRRPRRRLPPPSAVPEAGPA